MKVGARLLLVAVGVLLTALVAVATSLPIRQALVGNWDFTKSVERDTGTYYRLKVKLTYKGEPQDFDIIVGCNTRQTNYRDGGRTVEVGLIPSVFGRRMSDGKGLVVRPPDACSGQTTENGGIAPDLLPVVVVFESADTFAFGTAYLSDDAYEGPLSDLKFGGATVEKADAAAFEQFRREQPNAITRSQYHTPRGVAALKKHGLPAARIPMAGGCSGYARYRFVAADRERVHALWSADRPRYWVPQTDTERDAADALVYNRPMLSDHPDAVPRPRYGYMWGLNVEIANHGLARRHPVPWKGHAERPPVPSYYPDIGGWVARPWPTDPVARAEELLRKGPRVGASIDFRGGITRGFAYCYPYPEKFPTGVTYPDPWTAPGVAYFKIPQMNYVDQSLVVHSPRLGLDPGPRLIVERDEFVFIKFGISLQSTRGDV